MITLPPLAADPSIRIYGIEDDTELLWVAEWVSQRPTEVLGLDCESNGEDPFSPLYRLRTVQMSDGYTAFDINAERCSLGLISRVIREHGFWTAHYSEAEVRFLMRGCPGAVRFDQDTPHIADTQPVLAWFDPRTVTSQDDAYGNIPLNKGLKPAVTHVLGTTLLADAETALHAHFHEIAPKRLRKQAERVTHGFAVVPFEDPRYLLYGGLDAVFVKRMWDTMTAEVRRRGQWPGLQKDLALQWHIDRMTCRGLQVDGPYAQWLDLELEKLITAHLPTLLMYGIPASGQGKSVGVAFNALGFHSPKETDTGAESFDKFVLGDLAKTHGPAGELARVIIAVRKARKFRSTYIKPMLLGLTRDGCIHCSMRGIGTITTRQSAMGPPVQQLPKKDTRVRAAICAPDGWVFVSCDLSQGEPRTMAALSQDRHLLADILSGDLNSAVTSAVFGALYDPAFGGEPGTVHYLMRQGGKRAFLAWCYGASPRKVAESLTQDFDEDAWSYVGGLWAADGDGIVGRWMARYPDLTRYRNDMNAGRFVRLESGWIAPLWDRAYMDDYGVIRDKGKPSRKGLNYATQGNQRNLLATAVHQLVAWGWSWALAMLVHDEILLCVPESMAEAAKQALLSAMTMTFHGVPIEAEAKICGRTWTKQPTEFDTRELEHVEV